MEYVLVYIFYLFAFLFGAIVGSFLNVVVCRYNTGLSALSGRSKCFSCGKTLSWYELIPIVSYIVQRGRCRVCKSTVSIQYPLVEVVTGVLFVCVFRLAYPLIDTLFLLLLASVAVVISAYDIKHKIIPDGPLYTFLALTLLPLVFSPDTTPAQWLAGPLVALPFATMWHFSGGRWMGFGDVKIALGMGWLLGVYYGISAIILAIWGGAISGLALIVYEKFTKKKKRKHRHEMPFGPFLFAGLLVTLLFGVDAFALLSWYA